MRIREIKESIIKEYSINKSTASSVEDSDEFNFGFEIEAVFQRIKNPELEKYIKKTYFKIPLNISFKKFRDELSSLDLKLQSFTLTSHYNMRWNKEIEAIKQNIKESNFYELFTRRKKLSQEEKNDLLYRIIRVTGDSPEEVAKSDYKKWIDTNNLGQLKYYYKDVMLNFIIDKNYHNYDTGYDLGKFLKSFQIIDDDSSIFKIVNNELRVTVEYFVDGYATVALKDKNDGGTLGRIAKVIENDTGITFNQKDNSYKNYKIVEDESIKSSLYDDVITGEIVSPILSVKDGLRDLKVLFDWLSKNGAVTNESTGFHVNISIKGNPPLNKLKLIILFDEQKVLDEFDRNQNVYTLPQLRRLENAAKEVNPSGKTIKEIEEILTQHISMDKYSSINFMKQKNNYGHIEWRILGNKDYHLKYDIIKKRIIEMIFAMKVASTDLYEKEYEKKLMKLVKTID